MISSCLYICTRKVIHYSIYIAIIANIHKIYYHDKLIGTCRVKDDVERIFPIFHRSRWYIIIVSENTKENAEYKGK